MTIDVTLPSTAPTVTEARVGQWLKRVGDAVRAGEPLAEIESDKTVTELESPADGVLVEILVPANTDDVPVGTLLARIGQRPPQEPAEARRPTPPTPLAARVARLLDIDTDTVAGSGADGRVTLRDLPRPAAAPRPAAPAPVRPAARAPQLIPHTAQRRVTARRLSEAKQRIPHFYLHARVCVDRLLALRAEINAIDDGAARVSVNDCALRAVALALASLPELNVSWSEDGLLQNPSVDVAVAVAGPAGLVTPVLRDADRLSLRRLAEETRELAARARSGALAPDEYQGGSCTVSNLGMYGVDGLYAIVNPPQSFIVGVGRVVEAAIVRDGQIVPGHVMECTLSGDHRAVDGAAGARLLTVVRELLEQPLQLLL